MVEPGISFMDSRSFFKRQRAVLLANDELSGAKIGERCTIVDIDPSSRRRHPSQADWWLVRVYVPGRQQYCEVRARDLLGLQERDDSPLPVPVRTSG
jgi:hypothetical protein